MTIELRNFSQYVGKEGRTNWWRWTAYLEVSGSDSYDDIEYVEYQLHSSFLRPIQRVRHAKSKFAISAKGWGTFQLRAMVVFKNEDRKPLNLKHVLEFEDKNLQYENV